MDIFNLVKVQSRNDRLFPQKVTVNHFRRRDHIMNVCLDGQNVYKVFDSRERAIERSPKYYYQFLADCIAVVDVKPDKYSQLVIIRYPFIPGNHLPDNSHQILAALQSLYRMHSKNIVHGDVKAGNIIFAEEANKSCLIDFCFSGVEGDAVYPSNYRREIQDGARHPDAEPLAIIRKEHDIFGFKQVLEFCYPADNQDLPFWKSLLQVLSGESLEPAIALIKNHHKPVYLETNKQFLGYLGSGAPPKKRNY
jgi:serine/threonine protein kinase